MFEKLRALFGKPDPIIRACRSNDLEKLAASIQKSQLYFLCLPATLATGVNPERATVTDMVEQVRNTVADLNVADRFVPFCYDREGRSCMPVFTDENSVTRFVQMYAARKKRILTFQVLSADGPKLIPTFRNCDVVTFNAGSLDEHSIARDQILKLVPLFE